MDEDLDLEECVKCGAMVESFVMDQFQRCPLCAENQGLTLIPGFRDNEEE